MEISRQPSSTDALDTSNNNIVVTVIISNMVLGTR